MKYLGCAYYPEYWGVQRVPIDAKLMRDAGINCVRIAEFAWGRLEPTEGVFDFDWLEKSLDVLGRHGISVLMCTPTAAPPAWLITNYPDTALVRHDGVREPHGVRRHYCFSSPRFRDFSARIVDRLSKVASSHGCVIGWQIDNELCPEIGWCYCEQCQERFRAWLREKYSSLDVLNRQWGTGFWTGDHTDWAQIRLAQDRANHSRILDSLRFWSGLALEFAAGQAVILRRNHPTATLTTNGTGSLFGHVDYYKLFAGLDVASDDLYMGNSLREGDYATLDWFRGIKRDRPFWITETGIARPATPEQFRPRVWTMFAHGAEAVFIFRWRGSLSGQEQDLLGILTHAGEARVRYHAVKRCFGEMESLRSVLGNLPLPKSEVAIMHDYDSGWAFRASRLASSMDIGRLTKDIHAGLRRRNITADFVCPGSGLSGYRLVILQSVMIVSPTLGEQLTQFISEGGVVLAMGPIGIRDAFNNHLSKAGPRYLQDLLGLRIEDGIVLGKSHGTDAHQGIGLGGSLNGKALQGNARVWAGDITLDGAQVLMDLTESEYAGQPAIVEKKTGRGTSVYVAAAQLDEKLFEEVLTYVIGISGVAQGPITPQCVNVVRRGDVTFYINHSNESVKILIGGEPSVIVGTCRDGLVHLEANGVCVLRDA